MGNKSKLFPMTGKYKGDLRLLQIPEDMIEQFRLCCSRHGLHQRDVAITLIQNWTQENMKAKPGSVMPELRMRPLKPYGRFPIP